MINQSLEHGGPGCTVATWEELTGIHIDHFMMIDFAGVVSMADAVGGVPVCVDANVYSHDSQGHGSGLKLTKGTHTVKGEQALQWLRTRLRLRGRQRHRPRQGPAHVHELDGPPAEARTPSSADPGKLRDLAEAATKALTVDEGLGTVKKLYDLGNELKTGADRAHHHDDDALASTPRTARTCVPKPGDADQAVPAGPRRHRAGRQGQEEAAPKSPSRPRPAPPRARSP